MSSANVYDITQWPVGDPYEDVGEVMNSILADIKQRQTRTDERNGGKPGAVIYIPPGDYRLATQVRIDISYLKIMGSGHGFTSSSIRFNEPESRWGELHELWPGGSRIMVDLPAAEDQAAGAAFYVQRPGSPRVSSVEFEGFCIDGLHFVEDGSGEPNPENTYRNGKTGIYVASAQDSFRITGMGLVYLEHGVTIYHGDALSIHDNFIAECGSCIELRGWGQASKVTENLLGAGFHGYSIFAENFGGLLVSSNNVFPRGRSSVCFEGVTRSSITGNRFHSFYPGMVVLDKGSSENLVSGNHLLRDQEPWPPMFGHSNGLDDSYGLVFLSGNYNTVTGNHISEYMEPENLRPQGIRPVMVRVAAGRNNYISNNHMAATAKAPESQDGQRSCFSAQVEALLAAGEALDLPMVAVKVERGSEGNTVLDSGTERQVEMDRSVNAFRPTPEVKSRRDGLPRLGDAVAIKIDRPVGTAHPKHPDLIYPINYGYVPGLMAPDGEEQDAYVLGVEEPLEEFTGRLIAIIHRFDDVEEKWVLAPEGKSYTKEEVRELTRFQERYYHIEIRM